jgi:hypothetical protein
MVKEEERQRKQDLEVGDWTCRPTEIEDTVQAP